jgi:ergothioneine biosynthesis protein EgtB
MPAARALDRQALLDWFDRSRERSRRLFGLIRPDAYLAQPIALRHPIIFYDGHLAAFNLNTLVKRGLGQPGVDEHLDRLFARGIDPDAPPETQPAWPARDTVRAYVEECDRRVRHALANEDLDRPGHPLLDRAQAAHAMLEHEAMHQETLLYIFHELPYSRKQRPDFVGPIADERPPGHERIAIPRGRATLGADPEAQPFGWDNEFPRMVVDVPAFTIDAHNVTNRDYLAFIEAGGYTDPRWWDASSFARLHEAGITHPHFWAREGDALRPGSERPDRDSTGRYLWRGMFERISLPLSWPVYVTQAEASAYARWQGARLPTEAEFHRAAYGSPSGEEREQPWGDADPSTRHGNFDFADWDPAPAGSHPAGRSAWGVHDLVGNGWEWTSTIFDGFPGFRPLASYPEYSADFFDGKHDVMKGASPATARELIRRSFRNWFRPDYPYVYATFRCVRHV